MRHRRRSATGARKGVALLLALVLIVILSVTAAGALGMVGGERRVVEDQEAASEVSAMARSAYDRFITNPTGIIPSFGTTFVGPDSGTVTYSDGYAVVKVQRVRPSVSGSAPLFLVRSRAVRTSNRPGKTPLAQRTFAQYAQWQDVQMPVQAAWTSLSGLLKSGSSGTIAGQDNCGGPPVAGVAVPNNPGYVQSGNGGSVPSGSPAILNMGSQPAANSMVDVDWPTILGGMSANATVVLPGGTWPSFSDPNYWPIVYVDQASAYSLPNDGRGMLIVKNDLVMGGSVKWDGIILVGGTFTSNGNNTVKGAIVTGLNVLLGQNVPPSNIGNGTKVFRYDSCNVASALGRFNGLAPLRNAGADNWASY